MSILISFLPWLVYWIFLSLRNLYLAIFGGLALSGYDITIYKLQL